MLRRVESRSVNSKVLVSMGLNHVVYILEQKTITKKKSIGKAHKFFCVSKKDEREEVTK